MLDKELGLNSLLDLTLQPLRGLPGVRQSKIHKSYNQIIVVQSDLGSKNLLGFAVSMSKLNAGD